MMNFMVYEMYNIVLMTSCIWVFLRAASFVPRGSKRLNVSNSRGNTALTEDPKDLENYYELLLVICIAWLARKSLFALSICQGFLEGTTIHDDELDGVSSKKHNCN